MEREGKRHGERGEEGEGFLNRGWKMEDMGLVRSRSSDSW